jgi:DNA-binding MarR family transcriptional regulator
MSENPQEYITDALEMMGIVEPKKIETQISGWIPVFDYVASFYNDPITALVFGRRWQYCGMEDGVCRASLSKIAKDLHLDEATVMRHTEKLVKDGFLVDTTPDRRNRPHVYKDGGKVTMKTAINAHVAQSNTSIAQSNVGIAESQLIKQDNTKINKDANASRLDLVDLELSKLPAMSIRKAIHEYFRLNVNWDTKTSRQWLEWAHGENVTAEQIERAAKVWREDKAFNWQTPTLKGIFEKWQLLMDASKPADESPRYFTDENEDKYVPNPRTK